MIPSRYPSLNNDLTLLNQKIKQVFEKDINVSLVDNTTMVDDKYFEKNGININENDGTRRLALNLITVMRKHKQKVSIYRSTSVSNERNKRWAQMRFVRI